MSHLVQVDLNNPCLAQSNLLFLWQFSKNLCMLKPLSIVSSRGLSMHIVKQNTAIPLLC